MASGTARSREKTQMSTARSTMLVVVLDVWMSRGFTMALYLVDILGRLTF